MSSICNIFADAATLAALLQVVTDEQSNDGNAGARARVSWLLPLAVKLADQLAADVEAHCERGA
jgi:hypothetical protein